MQHIGLSNTESRTRQAWIERFTVPGGKQELIALENAVDTVLALPRNSNPLQPASLDVAEILRHLDVDQTTLIAALLCDERLDAQLSLDSIAKTYGATVRGLCKTSATCNTSTTAPNTPTHASATMSKANNCGA